MSMLDFEFLCNKDRIEKVAFCDIREHEPEHFRDIVSSERRRVDH